MTTLMKPVLLFLLTLCVTPAASAADINGAWKIHGSVFFNAVDTICHFKAGEGGGTEATCENKGMPGAFTPAAVTDKTVAWNWDAGPAVLSFQAAFTSDTAMKGEIKVRGFTGSFTATRQ
ncbi:MAG: hypothetical protein JWM91_3226 [Rhodospirillales bacterium]|nr:hypothetical protein [Rhodospirillales bacterium]